MDRLTSHTRLLLALLVGTLMAAGCAGTGRSPPARGVATVSPPRPSPPSAQPVGPTQVGIASHYADRFAGRPTASGEPYRPAALTAAHRTLPLGSVVRVTRIDAAGTTVAGPIVVRINDRGPYTPGRIIDLSAAGARKLNMFGGLARVKVEALEIPESSGRRRGH